jgi:hypothetical protein
MAHLLAHGTVAEDHVRAHVVAGVERRLAEARSCAGAAPVGLAARRNGLAGADDRRPDGTSLDAYLARGGAGELGTAWGAPLGRSRGTPEREGPRPDGETRPSADRQGYQRRPRAVDQGLAGPPREIGEREHAPAVHLTVRVAFSERGMPAGERGKNAVAAGERPPTGARGPRRPDKARDTRNDDRDSERTHRAAPYARAG